MNRNRKHLTERVVALEKTLADRAAKKSPDLSEAEVSAFIDLFPRHTPITYADWLEQHPEHTDVAETVFAELHDWQPDIYTWSTIE